MAKGSTGLHRFTAKVREFWTNNPVLVNGLTLAPVAVAAIYLKNAAAISIIMAIVTIPTLVVSSLIKQRVALCHRIPIYAGVSAVCYVGAIIVVRMVLPTAMETAGMYLPLLMTNSVIMMRAEAFGTRNKTRWVLLDAGIQVLGYAFVVCVIGAVREYIGNATLWGIVTDNPLPIKGVLLPFGGFILIGLFAALYQFVTNHTKERHMRALHMDKTQPAQSDAEEVPV
ncbi:MAG: Rnf-Nqr domain containing protein [Acetanaerobacterium sp.]